MASGADLSAPVRTVMSSPPAAVASDATVGKAIRMMAEGAYRHLPIVDKNQKPTGVLAVHGIVHYLVDHFPETVYNLPPDTEGGQGCVKELKRAASSGVNHCRTARTFNNNRSWIRKNSESNHKIRVLTNSATTTRIR